MARVVGRGVKKKQKRGGRERGLAGVGWRDGEKRHTTVNK